MKKKEIKKANIKGKDANFIISKHFHQRWLERVDKTYDTLPAFKEVMLEYLGKSTLSHISGDYFLLNGIIIVADFDKYGNVILLTTLGKKDNCPDVYNTIKFNGARYFKKILREYGNLYLGPEAPVGKQVFMYN